MEDKKKNSLPKSFLAGVDPTGVHMQNIGMTDDSGSKKHQIAGAAGGTVSGFVQGAALPAALTAVAAGITRKSNPALAKSFSDMTKGSLDVFNPVKMKKYMQSLPHSAKLNTKMSQMTKNMKELSRDTDKIKKSSIPPDVSKLKSISDKAENLDKSYKSLERGQQRLSKKYFDNADFTEGVARSFGAVSTAGGAALSAGIGGLSSAKQYAAGKRTKEMLETEKTDGHQEKVAYYKSEIIKLARR